MASGSAVMRVGCAALVAAAAACARDAGNAGDSAALADARDSAAATRDAATRTDSARPVRLASIAGFKAPESVRYDADQDVYLVSNVNGNPNQKDNNGFIVRAKPDAQGTTFVLDTLVRGGASGVTLNAPKGMAIVGDTLWVADIDVVRAFNKRTGASIASVNLAGMQAIFLNDVVSAPDGVYITDTGIRFAADGSMSKPGKDRVFRIGPDRKATLAIESDSLGGVNGIAWDAGNNQFVLGPFSAPAILTWKVGTPKPNQLALGPGGYDGVEVLADGRILVTSWADSALHVISGGLMRKTIGGLEAPADIGYDTKRTLVVIPRFNGNSVELWRLR